MKRYGEEILLLDAIYCATRYLLQLFFVTVKTNIDYQIVATLVTENKTKLSILKALTVLKSWIPSFRPSYCMTDSCNEEIDSLAAVFPGILNIS